MAKRYRLLLALLAPFGVAAQAACALMLAGLAFGMVMSRATAACPLSHRTRDLASCEISDRRGGATLIQHAELDINESYVEVQTASGSVFYASPRQANAFIQEDLRLARSGGFTASGVAVELKEIVGPTF